MFEQWNIKLGTLMLNTLILMYPSFHDVLKICRSCPHSHKSFILHSTDMIHAIFRYDIYSSAIECTDGSRL